MKLRVRYTRGGREEQMGLGNGKGTNQGLKTI
jgi:hypothetical protein